MAGYVVQEEFFFSGGSDIGGPWKQIPTYSEHLNFESTDYIPDRQPLTFSSTEEPVPTALQPPQI